MQYTVGQAAKKVGISASALRYYDKEGLLPFVRHASGGARIFGDEDIEWLRVISCLKKTGMPLRDIREFMHMALQGDETIEARLALFIRQREAVRRQMAELQETLDTLDFKCWYYETAKAAGTTDVPERMSPEEIPEKYRKAREKLIDIK